jgi:uncharacterized membrane protein (UPF0127 family)
VAINASGGEEVEVRVEIANDASEQARSLMYCTALVEDRGILFVFPTRRSLLSRRNILIPLSVDFIDSKGRIVDIQDMKLLDDDLLHYVSAEPAQYALEVNQVSSRSVGSRWRTGRGYPRNLRDARSRRSASARAISDGALSTLSLHHWPDPGRGLAEVHRVLKPGGEALIYDLAHWLWPPAHGESWLARIAAPSPFGGGEVEIVRWPGSVPAFILLRLRRAREG